VPGASPSREQDGPLNLAARLGLYVMLAGLVLASFTLTPERSAPTIAAPKNDGQTEARIMHVSRGVIRGLREFERTEPIAKPSPTLSPTPEPNDTLSVEAVREPVPAAAIEPVVTVESLPAATAEPEPATTPEATPPPTPRPAPRPVVVVTNPTTLWAETHMLELMNASRLRAGLVPLAMDVAVANTARAHSSTEAHVRFVYHDGPDGTANSRDVSACGTGWYGENTGKIWNDNVDALHIEFINEPWEPINHRTNIMDPAFRRVGVGAVIGSDAMYMTMVFCR